MQLALTIGPPPDLYQEPQQEVLTSSLAKHISNEWERARHAKRQVEERFLRNLRQRRGKYEPEKLAEIRKFGGSEIFMRVTETKCRALEAWLVDILTMDRPFMLIPTPISDLPPDVAAQVEERTLTEVYQESISQMAAMAVQVSAIERLIGDRMQSAKDEVLKEMQTEARQRAARMEDKIDDQLKEGGWRAAFRLCINDFATFGVCIMKGPVVLRKKQLKWAVDPFTGAFQPEMSEVFAPTVERVSPFDIYPVGDFYGIQDGAVIERARMAPHELTKFRGAPHFSSEAMDRALLAKGTTHEPVDSERRELESENYTGAYQNEPLEVLMYHGQVEGKSLVEWGVQDVEDPSEYYPVEAWMVGREVIRVSINDDPYGRNPYAKACYSEAPDSFWGTGGVPELMTDIQQQANAAARALANNVAMASGPQIAAVREAMPEGTDATKIWPWKVWDFEQAYATNGQPPISFFQPNMHGTELMNIYQQWVAIADDVTGVPAYVAGDDGAKGAGKTASGLSMLMSAASRTVRDLVGRLDLFLTEQIISNFYIFNMLYDDDDSIKGDLIPVARGATTLLVKEQMQVRRNEFLQATNNPLDSQIMGPERRAELLRNVAESLEMEPDDVAPTREEMEKRIEQQQQMVEQQMATQQQVQAAATGPDGQPANGQDFRLFG